MDDMNRTSEGPLKQLLSLIKQGKVSGVTSDSRQVRQGYVFVAMPGSRLNGCDFIADAIKNGASFVVLPKNTALHAPPSQAARAAFVEVPDLRDALARLAAAFYGFNTGTLRLIGITGTNGKTTISYLLESVFQTAAIQTGVMGTINTRFKGVERPSMLTTPDVVTLHRTLREMSDAGVEAVVMEVSSHALDQRRVAGCNFHAAIFTNLTHDHLDYHRDMEAYYQAKRRLFTEYAPEISIVNIDDAYGKRLWNEIEGRKISYGFHGQAMVRPVSYASSLHGIQMEVATPLGPLSIVSSLVGRYNISNILAVIAASIGIGIEKSSIEEGIAALSGVPGRLEPIRFEGIHAFVDYAHTPDALFNVLRELSDLKMNARLLCVFGCGGDRDRSKRPEMAHIAASWADEAVMTSDNPRSEDPNNILLEMWRGLFPWPEERRCRVHVEPNRKKAIALACSLAREGDCILVAGKGHETYQEIAGVRHAFDDRLVLQESLQNRIGVLPEFTLEDITNALGIAPSVHLSGNIASHSISHDSRSLYPSQIFWALNGLRFKGVDFVKEAVQKAAIAVVVNEQDRHAVAGISQDTPVFFVPDSLYALGEMARFHRRRSGYRVIGVTGSCGKTTTKEMIASILGQRARVLKTQGNYNNLIGLPLTILDSPGNEDWAVLEMGMNQPGEIGRLCEIAGPCVGVITNVKPVHLEGLGDIYGVLREKTALWRGMDENGLAVVNLDDALLAESAGRLGGAVQKIGYSLHEGPAAQLDLNRLVYLKKWSVLENGTRLELAVRDAQQGEQVFSAELKLIGIANLQNALCAAATAIGLDYDIQSMVLAVQAGLEAVRPVKGRLELKAFARGLYIIDDTYNANPASMELALQTLKLWGRGELWAILGDMFELGVNAEAYHAQVGRLAAACGLNRLFVAGGFANTMANAAFEAGISPDAVRVYENTEALVSAVSLGDLGLQNGLAEGEITILVKASRGMGLERVVQAVKDILEKD
jgi:murE/murF fusion protein